VSRLRRCLLIATASLSLLSGTAAYAETAGGVAAVGISELPVQARQTLELIKRGGPFPYARDGKIFGNYEQILPQQKRGHYREYTVPTPGKRNRGARRIVAGGVPQPVEFFYTADHYASFRRIRDF